MFTCVAKDRVKIRPRLDLCERLTQCHSSTLTTITVNFLVADHLFGCSAEALNKSNSRVALSTCRNIKQVCVTRWHFELKLKVA